MNALRSIVASLVFVVAGNRVPPRDGLAMWFGVGILPIMRTARDGLRSVSYIKW